jgi:glycosyltransferase involved in cell wall biosynthesis
MKLCIIAKELAHGGAERVVATLANYWAAKGWQITLITLASTDGDFYKLSSSITRMALDMEKPIRNPYRRIITYIKKFLAIRRALKQANPDIAMAFMPVSNVICGLACLGTGIPAVGSEHSHPPNAPLGWHWKMMCRLVYPHLAAVSALTEESATWVRERIGGRRVVVMPNPIEWPLPRNKPELNPRNTLAPLEGKRLLLGVGRLAEEKGFDRLLVTFAKLQSRHSDWRLAILGEGPLRGRLEKMRSDLGLDDRVVLPGVAGNIGEWYEYADAYVLTSLFEGFGNSLAESLAYGVPAVAVDCETGPRAILRNGIDGLLIPQDQPDALLAALDKLMSDEALRKKFSENAVQVLDRFAVTKIAGKWEELFNEQIGTCH